MAKSGFSLELNSSGVREFLKSPEMQAVLKEHADATIRGLGDGYEVNAYTGKNRANVSILVTSWDAYNDNLDSNTILKALK